MTIARTSLAFVLVAASASTSCRRGTGVPATTSPSPSSASLASIVAQHVALELSRFDNFHGETGSADTFQLYVETDSTAWGHSVLEALGTLRPGLTRATVSAVGSRILRRDGVARRGIRVGEYGLVGDTAIVQIWRAQCDPAAGRVTLYIERWRWRFIPTPGEGAAWTLVDSRRQGGADGWCTPRPS